MASTPPSRRPPRSAASVNADIRALWVRTRGRLSADERVAYEHLVVEWAAAVRGENRRAA
ncbi:hypothetical protein ACFQVC_27825 [Streptomyces monticola]|uniref:Uncharacterized protein n=1 Tax=Streptomyces monticola TaxID=2666263 RepID=A0ABW2JS10_9ACTN